MKADTHDPSAYAPLPPPPGPLAGADLAKVRSKASEIKARQRRADWWCGVSDGIRDRFQPWFASIDPKVRADGRRMAVKAWPARDQIPSDLD